MTTVGDLIGQILMRHGVKTIFYLCGGLIPVGCKKAGELPSPYPIWSQIALYQLVGAQLIRAPYHLVAEGYGDVGFLLDYPDQIDTIFAQAKQIARNGKPVFVNVYIAKSDFRKGSLSM
jgi:thiamine pyrophosphate-dependent acetolactate synthase large subunit-like protein